MTRNGCAPTIRPAVRQDLVAVAALYHRVWHETHGPQMPRAECDVRDPPFFLDRVARLMPNVVVGEDSSSIFGFAAWSGPLLGQIFVDAALRGSGLAQGLLAQAERGLRDQGVYAAELHCLVGNARARRFYEGMGWQVMGMMAEPLRGTTGDETRDFWVMRKALAPAPSDGTSVGPH